MSIHKIIASISTEEGRINLIYNGRGRAMTEESPDGSISYEIDDPCPMIIWPPLKSTAGIVDLSYPPRSLQEAYEIINQLYCGCEWEDLRYNEPYSGEIEGGIIIHRIAHTLPDGFAVREGFISFSLNGTVYHSSGHNYEGLDIAAYHLSPDGKLVGEWIRPGIDGTVWASPLVIRGVDDDYYRLVSTSPIDVDTVERVLHLAQEMEEAARLEAEHEPRAIRQAEAERAEQRRKQWLENHPDALRDRRPERRTRGSR